MEGKVYAVIDTNVIVSALISKSEESNPVKIIKAVTRDRIIPLFNDEIPDEYRKVLSRDKFKVDKALIEITIQTFVSDGISLEKTAALDEYFPDPKDVVFYEIALSKKDSYLVTGNLKHFPAKSFVITPAQMVEILEQK